MTVTREHKLRMLQHLEKLEVQTGIPVYRIRVEYVISDTLLHSGWYVIAYDRNGAPFETVGPFEAHKEAVTACDDLCGSLAGMQGGTDE